MNKVSQVEILEPVMADRLALSSPTNLSKKRIREEAISPAKLVTIDVEGDGGGDCLTRKAGSTRRFGSLMTPRTRSRSMGRSLVMGRGDGGRLPHESCQGRCPYKRKSHRSVELGGSAHRSCMRL